VASGVPARRYATIAAFESALKANLAARVTEQRTYQDVRKQLAFDRVLARLGHVAPDGWLLKGGVALEYRLQRARATTDIDISARADVEKMTETLERAAAAALDDYFALRLGERSKPADDVETYRFHVTVLYENGRTFESLKIDVGFADRWLGEPQEVTAPPLLDFAGIQPATVRAISIEQHLAEKIHAYTRRYGSGESTRVKDLVDMVLLIDAAPVDNEALARTLCDIFTARGTHDVPAALPPPPAAWRAVYARLAADLPIPRAADEAHRHVAGALAVALEIAASSSEARRAGHAGRLAKRAP
jgi:predicted nucleotidyltransferase component of viral defense system